MTAAKPELLAPAGGRSQLETAIRFGADAVYLACDRFGMRQRAENFTLDNLPETIALAHRAGVPVHVTLNTTMSDDDVRALPEYCEALQDAGADAFIISDLGAFSVAKRYAPSVDLHVSTQASVSNVESARMWHDLGASRVVLAREMSMEQIADLCAAKPRDLEIETFVHGAMCMAVSGRCLISAVMTGRSGNRGHCSQSCRWSYALVEEKRPGEYYPVEEDVLGTYVMNAQDMCMIEHLDDLKRAGVSSFKIEGRNKKALYVATVVHAYRQVMDGADPREVVPELYAISHRPYGTGFFYGKPQQSPDQDGYVKDCVHVATVQECEPCEGRYRVRVLCYNRFCEGDGLELLAPHRAVETVTVSGLAWLPDDESSETGYSSTPVDVDVANRSVNNYVFYSDSSCQPGDFLRKRI